MTVDQIPIGKFSLITRISQKALRYYDSKALLIPEAKDTITGFRYYTSRQLDNGIKIKTLSILGFSVEEMKSLLDAMTREDTDEYDRIIQIHREQIKGEISRLERVESLLKESNPNEIIKMTATK